MNIPDKGTIKFSCLRLGLMLGSIGWGASFLFTFSSWEFSAAILESFGLAVIEYQPIVDYWLKMASSVFGCIGILFFLCFRNPHKYFHIICLLGYFSIFIGLVLIGSSLCNNLNQNPRSVFLADICFCLLTGSLILSSLLGKKSSN